MFSHLWRRLIKAPPGMGRGRGRGRGFGLKGLINCPHMDNQLPWRYHLFLALRFLKKKISCLSAPGEKDSSEIFHGAQLA